MKMIFFFGFYFLFSFFPSPFQIDVTAVIGSFFPEIEELIAWLYKGGRKKTNDVIISWCNDILRKRRKMGFKDGKFQNKCRFLDFTNAVIPTGVSLGEKPIDSLQLMMDASESHGKISDDEISANAFVFILAG